MFFSAAALTAAGVACAQANLTLGGAIQHAKANNGFIVASDYDVRIAESQVRAALSAFWPRITPEYRYVDQHASSGFGSTSRFHDLGVSSSWRLLDGGQRQFALAGSRNSAQAARFDQVDTVRSTIFAVTVEFFETLRSRELVRVADAQVGRANQTLEATRAQVELGASAAKDILQADADRANAQVSLISARNSVSVSESSLRAILGWRDTDLPALEEPTDYVEAQVDSLEDAIARGLSGRPDLLATQKRLEAQRYGVLSAERAAGFDWTVDVSHFASLEPTEGQSRGFVFALSFPLVDGGLARENLRQSRDSLAASRILHEQQLRDAVSQIESAYRTREQNRERLEASRLALEAARKNFDAASESHAEGAGTVLDVTSAQLTLVTAETNHVEALYDYYISDAQLRLVIGEPLYGEQ